MPKTVKPDPEIARLYAELKASAPDGVIRIERQSEGHVRWLNECARLSRVNGTVTR